MKTVRAQRAICALIVAVAIAAASKLGHTAGGERAVCIAVLDFRDLGPSVELEPLRRALARMLTTDLSAFGQVTVVARERVDRMIRETHLGESGLVSAETAQQAGRALAADYLVQGTFSGAAEGVKVHAEVFDVAAGKAISSADLSGKPDDVLAIEAKLLAAVAKALNLEAPVAALKPPASGKAVTLAVLSFQNLSPDAKLDPMEIGFADTLISYLQERPGLAVVEREQLNKVLDELKIQKSALGENGRAARIGQMLGAQVMLLGSFLVVKEAIRFDAHLVAADTGALLQAVSVQASTDDLERPLRALADKVAAALAAGPRIIALPERKGQTSVEAMLHFSRAITLATNAKHAEAARAFEQCLYLDPENARAMSLLAMLYHFRLNDWAKAAEMCERLIASGLPDDYGLVRRISMLSFDYQMMGRLEAGLPAIERALESRIRVDGRWDQERINALSVVAQSNINAGHLESGRRWYRLGIEKAPSLRSRLQCRLDVLRGLPQDDPEIPRQCQAVLAEAAQHDPWMIYGIIPESIQGLGNWFAARRDYAGAKQALEPALARFGGTVASAQIQYALARVAEAAGRREEAAAAFVQAAEAAPAWYMSPEAMMRAVSLYAGPLGDMRRADELRRLIMVRYGPYDRYTKALPPKLAPPYEGSKLRPVLMDMGHGEDAHGSDAHQRFLTREAVTECGRWGHANYEPLSHQVLAGYAALMLNASDMWNALFAEEEVEAIRSFVATGGGLLLNVAGGARILGQDYYQYGRLLSVLGIGIPRGISIDEAEPVRATVTPNRPELSEDSAPMLWCGAPLLVPPETVLASHEGPVVAAFGYGLGRVVACGLGRGLTDILQAALGENDDPAPNKPFVRAAIRWITSSAAPSAIADAFQAARSNLAAGDTAGAVAGLRRIAHGNPGTRWEDEAMLLAAGVLRDQGDRQAAAAEYEKLARSAKEPQVKALARLNLARCHAAGGGPGVERALAECWAIWRDDPRDPWAPAALLEGGKWAYAAGLSAEADKAFETVMNSREQSMDKLQAMLWVARRHEERGNRAAAARIYRSMNEDYPRMYLHPPGVKDRLEDVKTWALVRAKELEP